MLMKRRKLNDKLHPTMKGHGMEPLLVYGMENLDLEQKDILKIKRIEGNFIKTILGLPTRCPMNSFLFKILISSGIVGDQVQLRT